MIVTDWESRPRSIPDTEDEEYPRDRLIKLARRAVVPEKHWTNRDSAGAQQQAAVCGALLQAGCHYMIWRDADTRGLCTNEKTVWVEIEFEGFMWFEVGQIEIETFYLPTETQLDAVDGRDWY